MLLHILAVHVQQQLTTHLVVMHLRIYVTVHGKLDLCDAVFSVYLHNYTVPFPTVSHMNYSVHDWKQWQLCGLARFPHKFG